MNSIMGARWGTRTFVPSYRGNACTLQMFMSDSDGIIAARLGGILGVGRDLLIHILFYEGLDWILCSRAVKYGIWFLLGMFKSGSYKHRKSEHLPSKCQLSLSRYINEKTCIHKFIVECNISPHSCDHIPYSRSLVLFIFYLPSADWPKVSPSVLTAQLPLFNWTVKATILVALLLGELFRGRGHTMTMTSPVLLRLTRVLPFRHTPSMFKRYTLITLTFTLCP